MMEKIKVSKRLGIALDSALKVVRGDKGKLLELGTYYWGDAIRIAINDLSTIELAEILVKGYEVEKTPVELLKHFETEIMIHSVIPGNEAYGKGARETIKFFKENFEIKGINDK